ncbi:MAG: hypothetical protein PHH24_04165 [Candidatus Moranbacteria bacterium]|jgi:hypothetical protein|nr:hypothetical protein [Candidatus Moranbacteria bacterium]MDD5651917.1 hypothetical protein [Candidatus Moranbacteria bacterium]MDX9855200.1 hypothetical protein [Candidatus Moranbacteria bacterium]
MKNKKIALGIIALVLLLPASALASNRLLYENFDDQEIDSRLITRVYGVWGVPESYYDLDHVGYGGTGYCFTGTSDLTDNRNEVFLSWEPHGDEVGPPKPWPTNEWYVAFQVKFPHFNPCYTDCYENIKMFYPAWEGTSNRIGYDMNGEILGGTRNTYYHSTKSDGVNLWNGNFNCTTITDGEWHKMEFYTDVYLGIHRMWVDGELCRDENHGIGAWDDIPFDPYYFTVGSIDASGVSDFSRAFDEIEIWDGMPDGTPPPAETCSDGIQNQDETGIDCGGVCPECETPVTYSLVNFISLLNNWLGAGDEDSDVNNDGIVNTRDLGIMMSGWSN